MSGKAHASPRGERERRQQLLQVVEEMRPTLHRYCARMTGSAADGEDVVQDTLARAYGQLARMQEVPTLRPWLFRIAHNRAIDYLRRYDRRMSVPLDSIAQIAADPLDEPGECLAGQDAVRVAFSRFLALAPAQRSCVILKDVLDHPLKEIAALLDLSVPAVKAALHRGRARLRQLSSAAVDDAASEDPPPALTRYAELFNARDWDGVRAMLVAEVKLDLVTRWKATGRQHVGTTYLGNYDHARDWHLVPALLDGRAVLAVVPDPLAAKPVYFIELAISNGRVAAIRDFRYVDYIADEASFELLS